MRGQLRLVAESLECRGLERDVSRHALVFERLANSLGRDDVVVDAAEPVLAAVRSLLDDAPLAAGPGVELHDLVLVAARPPPLHEQLRIGVGPEDELSRRVEHDSRDELLLAGLDHVLGLRHRAGLLRFHRFSPS